MGARQRTILGLLLAAVALLLLPTGSASADHYDHLLAPPKVCPQQKDLTLSNKAKRRAMRCMHNYAREKRGKRPLRRLRKLDRSARGKAEDILRCQDFSHDACGRDAFYWHKLVGFADGCYYAGENISMGSSYKGSVRYTMRGWLHSDGHRGAVLSKHYKRFGIGVVRGELFGYKVHVWVTHFGTRC